MVEIDLQRYDDLLHKEERLKLLENALMTKIGYSSIDEIKENYGIPEKPDRKTLEAENAKFKVQIDELIETKNALEARIEELEDDF